MAGGVLPRKVRLDAAWSLQLQGGIVTPMRLDGSTTDLLSIDALRDVHDSHDAPPPA